VPEDGVDKVIETSQRLIAVAASVASSAPIVASWQAVVTLLEGIRNRQARLQAINAVAAVLEHQTRELREVCLAYRGKPIPVEDILIVHQSSLERALALIREISDPDNRRKPKP